jgi:hypothetical protein
MPTVIDALIVTLGLDAKEFTKGQREALDAFRKTQDESVKGGKSIEEQSKKSMDALGGIKMQAVELFAVLAGGKGAVEFFKGLSEAGASLGRLSRNIGVSASVINAWQGAARLFGGTAEGMAESFTRLSDTFAGWKVGDTSAAPMMALFRVINTEAQRIDETNAKIIDSNKGVDQSFLDLAANLKLIHDKNPALAGLLGRKLGLDPALFDVLIRGAAGAKEVLDYVQKIGVATKENVDTFGELEKRMNQMGLKAESLGRKLLGGENGGASYIMRLADWLNESPGDAMKDMWEWLNSSRKARSAPAQKLFSNTGSGSGAFASQAEKEAFIRSEATKRGIDPDVAMFVAKHEGFNNFKSTIPGEQSFGAFQLHVTPGGRGNAVGDQFRKATGLDPADPANERRGITYALDNIKAGGWGPYHGAANSGIGAWQGINRGTAGSTTTTDIAINGPITINAGPNADGNRIAQQFRDTILKRQAEAAQANGGQQ